MYKKVLSVLIAVLLLVGSAAASSIHTPVGVFPDTGRPWALINAREVNFREGPGLEYRVLETWSWGVAVEVLGEQDGWVHVLRDRMYAWVWGEYLDFVE